ncbi:uncharacterized protein LOC129752591 [Uranotaenia lowii]|uniref:uncharacterized protein LOC129752591 n=1 Tax=Uranotaenia lowii TaxID=190385 RepID=UPI00247A2E7A|nr:uncharacterized protein LOC129752591 [Uranotaenia lowii]
MAKENHLELRALIDECTRHVEGLKFLDQEFTGVSELILIHLLTSALDKDTRRRWEGTIKHGSLPSYTETLKFLKEQCFILERCENSSIKGNQQHSSSSSNKFTITKANSAVIMNKPAVLCEFCDKDHPNFSCLEFRNLSIQERWAKVKEEQMCFNCLRRGHLSKGCPSNKTCSKCRNRHHSLLHFQEGTTSIETKTLPMPNSTQPSIQPHKQMRREELEEHTLTTAACASHQSNPPQVLLLTAIVDVLDENNKLRPCRVLLDSGSQVNLMSEAMATELRVKKRPSNVTVAGINGIQTSSSNVVLVELRSRYTDFRANIHCLITSRVTANIPSTDIDMKSFELPRGVELADPYFHKSKKIDMLLGNQWFMKLLMPGAISVADNLPLFRETQLGWVVGGEYDSGYSPAVVQTNTITLEQLNESVKKFWAVEEIPDNEHVLAEDEECEKHFLSTHQRDVSGRYVVELPLRDCIGDLGDSRSLARKRFFALERRLATQPVLKKQYSDFMEEYESLGHCKQVREEDDPPNLLKWYLPHHAVLRPSNSTTKCRVVFDASAKVNGLSLNDVLKVGSIPQSDLQSIVLRFREPRYVLSADIAKMYRQIRVDSAHTPLQRVFWRKDSSKPLRVLELTTVTYGTAAAPFLATRALKQLAIDEADHFPLATEVVLKNCYVDNLLFGFNDIEQASEAQFQLIQMLNSGGMPLHKWASNSSDLLRNVPEEDREVMVKIEEFGPNEVIKTLGLMWDPQEDELLFVPLPSSELSVPTKREVLSLIARIFDPLGLVAPVVVLGKLLMQGVWNEKIDWDEKITTELVPQWEQFCEAINSVGMLRIPRQVVAPMAIRFEIHGFADASLFAYGACVYIRSIIHGNTAITRLLMAKSRVVPKTVLTIPRKELLAALLLHRLVKKIHDAIQLPIKETVLWSDSQIVLAWLNKNPNQLDVFVRNRVLEIVTTRDEFKWQYVSTNENPADIVSRGLCSTQLAKSELWWKGPRFLSEEPYERNVPKPLPDDQIPELKMDVVVSPVVQFDEIPLLKKFESFRRLQRIIAYMLRFFKNSKEKLKSERSFAQYPTISEMRDALITIVRMIQRESFATEITMIESGEVPKNLKTLSPFLENGILRVGGRLKHSSLPHNTKHQLLLPNKHPVVKSLVVALHRENLHAGPSALMAIIRREFWILSGRSLIRKVTRECVSCYKFNPKVFEQFMGSLPQGRCEMSPAFSKVGVDFAGPILLRQGFRKASPVKGYICVFVCLVTKAIHLEAVENLSTEAFIAALHRFVGRRGVPETIHSDHGTNFVGARHELHQLYSLFKDQQTERQVYEFCQSREISWKMIPPNAPHMGGIWEAGVKSVKSVLKKVTKGALLNFVEFQTLLIRIEALLNSRPLYANPEDPSEPEALTPGHFVADRPLLAIPEPTYDSIPENRLSRWQYVQVLRNNFWKRWTREYLMELQARSKWTQRKPNVRPGMVVMIKDENLPPQSWKLGIIEKVYPGTDGCIRVVDLRTKSGHLQRPIHKLAPLPILDNAVDNTNLPRREDVQAISVHA